MSGERPTRFSQLTLLVDLHDGIQQTTAQRRLASLAIDALAADALSCFGATGSLLQSLLPQLNYYVTSVNAAAVSLGEALLMQSRARPATEDEEIQFAKLHMVALRTLQQGLTCQSFGTVPLLMSSLLLAGVEMLMKRDEPARTHLRGAYQLLHSHRRNRALSTTSSELPLIEDEVELLFRYLALQTASGAYDFLLALSYTSVPIAMPMMGDINEARVSFLRIFYPIYAWADRATAIRYCTHDVEPTVFSEQCLFISQLSAWLQDFDQVILPQMDSTSSGAIFIHALMLRMKCLSLLIWVTVALSPEETAYDDHAARFQQIIRDGETTIALRKTLKPPSIYTGAGVDTSGFSTGPGITQPLYFAAEKYRQPQWRRKAIYLLTQTRWDGPMYGAQEAAVAMRILQYEEAWPNTPSKTVAREISSPYPFDGDDPPTTQAIAIPEQARIHLCGRVDTGYVRHQRRTQVEFRRYLDLGTTIDCPKKHYRREIRKAEFREARTVSKADLEQQRCLDRHCETWDEEIDF